MHESQMHAFSSFVTLTYDDDHLPHDFSLDYSHFQLFMRRVRRYFSGSRLRTINSLGLSLYPGRPPTKKVGFFMCGEYGEDFSRPHYHACLFGAYFEDRELFRSLDSGSKLYTSKALSKLWPFGYVTIGDVTFESAAYVARYVMKKVTGGPAEDHYSIVDSCGEIRSRTPEFCQMSRRPGIGATYFAKYMHNIYPRDRVVVRGREAKPPRYYDKLLAAQPGYVSDEVQYKRQLKAEKLDPEDATPARLKDQEIVSLARLNLHRRKL